MRNKDWQEAILELTAFLDEWWYLPDITFPKSHSEIHNCMCWKCTFFSTYNLINGVPVHSCLELCSWREEKQGGETLLTQKSATDKSELENNLFCHTVRGSDCRVCLFIFIDQHESHFKIASPRTTLIASKVNVTVSFSLGSFILKKRKPKGRAILTVSGSSALLTLLQPHVLPFSSCLSHRSTRPDKKQGISCKNQQART